MLKVLLARVSGVAELLPLMLIQRVLHCLLLWDLRGGGRIELLLLLLLRLVRVLCLLLVMDVVLVLLRCISRLPVRHDDGRGENAVVFGVPFALHAACDSRFKDETSLSKNGSDATQPQPRKGRRGGWARVFAQANY